MFDTIEDNVAPITMRQAVFDTQSAMRSAASNLLSLSDAFTTTGNDKVATRLDRIAESLMEMQEILVGTFMTDLDRQVAESTQASHNIVEAALAGLALASRGSGRQEV